MAQLHVSYFWPLKKDEEAVEEGQPRAKTVVVASEEMMEATGAMKIQ